MHNFARSRVFAATVTPRTTDSISPTEQLLADEQATTMIPSTRSVTADDVKLAREVSSVQLPEAHVHGSSTYQHHHNRLDPLLSLLLTSRRHYLMFHGITQIILDVTMESPPAS